MNRLDGFHAEDEDTSVWVHVLNCTGNWVIEKLHFIPVDLIVLGIGAGVVWMWYQNLVCWMRLQRRKRAMRACRPADVEKYE